MWSCSISFVTKEQFVYRIFLKSNNSIYSIPQLAPLILMIEPTINFELILIKSGISNFELNILN